MKNKISLFDTEFAKLNGLDHGSNTTVKYLIDNRRIILTDTEKKAVYDTKGLASTAASAIVNGLASEELLDMFTLVDTSLSNQSLPELLAIADFTVDMKQMPGSTNVMNSIKEYKNKIIFNTAPIIKRTREGYVSLTNLNDFHLMITRGALVNSYYTATGSYWLNPNLLKFITRSYSSILAVPIVKHFRLSVPEQLLIETILAYFIMSRMADNHTELLSQCDFLGSKMTIKNTIDSIEERIGDTTMTLSSMCDLMVACGPDHMSKFNVDIFKRMCGSMGSSSISTNIALEYPPYWVYQLIYTLSDNKTYLGVLLQQTRLLKPAEQFLQQLISSRQFIPALKTQGIGLESLDSVPTYDVFGGYDNESFLSSEHLNDTEVSSGSEGIGLLLLGALAVTLGIGYVSNKIDDKRNAEFAKKLQPLMVEFDKKLQKAYINYKRAYMNIPKVSKKFLTIDKHLVRVEVDTARYPMESLEEFVKSIASTIATVARGVSAKDVINGYVYKTVNSPLQIIYDYEKVWESDDELYTDPDTGKDIDAYDLEESIIGKIHAVGKAISTTDVIYDVSDIGDRTGTRLRVSTYITTKDVANIVEKIKESSKVKSSEENLGFPIVDDRTAGADTTRTSDGTLIMDPTVGRLQYTHGVLRTLGEVEIPSFKGIITRRHISYEVVGEPSPTLTREQVAATQRMVKFGGVFQRTSVSDKHTYSLDSAFITREGVSHLYVSVDTGTEVRHFDCINNPTSDRIDNIVELKHDDSYTYLSDGLSPSQEAYTTSRNISQMLTNTYDSIKAIDMSVPELSTIAIEDTDNRGTVRKVIDAIRGFIAKIIKACREFIGKVVNFIKRLFGLKSKTVKDVTERFKYLKEHKADIDTSSVNTIISGLSEFINNKKITILDIDVKTRIMSTCVKIMETITEELNSSEEFDSSEFEQRVASITRNVDGYNLEDFFTGYMGGDKSDIDSKKLFKEYPVKEFIEKKIGTRIELSFDNIDTVYEQLYNTLSKSVDNINSVDVVAIDKLQKFSTWLDNLESQDTDIRSGVVNTGNFGGAKLIQLRAYVTGLTIIVNTTINRSLNTEIILYNELLKVFESALQQVTTVASKVLVQKETETVQELIKDVRVHDVIEGIDVYEITELLTTLSDTMPQYDAVLQSRDTSKLDGITFTIPGSSKMAIALSKPALDNEVFRKVIVAHEYGHIRHNHVSINLTKTVAYIVQATTGVPFNNKKLAQMFLSGMYRSVKQEIQADMEAYRRYGKEPVLELLNTLKSSYNIPGKVLGESSNDVVHRIKFFETKT